MLNIAFAGKYLCKMSVHVCMCVGLRHAFCLLTVDLCLTATCLCCHYCAVDTSIYIFACKYFEQIVRQVSIRSSVHPSAQASFPPPTSCDSDKAAVAARQHPVNHIVPASGMRMLQQLPPKFCYDCNYILLQHLVNISVDVGHRLVGQLVGGARKLEIVCSKYALRYYVDLSIIISIYSKHDVNTRDIEIFIYDFIT